MVMERERTNRSDIYKGVVQVLQRGNFNVNQIKEALNNELSWDAIKNALDVMKEMDIVKEESNKFSLKTPQLQKNPNTILGLPLTKEQEELFLGIAKRFKELWPKDKPFRKTFLQKMIVTLIEKENLDLPYGWYLYGECTAMKFNDDNWNNYDIGNKFDKSIIQIIDFFKNYDTTDDLMEEQYIKKNMDVYLARLTIDKLLKQSFTTENLKVIDMQIRKMIFSFEEESDNEDIWKFINSFYSIFGRLRKLPIEDIENIRMDIIISFKSVWELIGTYKFYRTSSKNYEKDISPYYTSAISPLKDIAESHLFNLDEYCPNIVLSDETKRIRDALVKKSQPYRKIQENV